MFHAKQTIYELLKQESAKNALKSSNLARNFNPMSTPLDFNHVNTIIYLANIVVFQVSYKTNQV